MKMTKVKEKKDKRERPNAEIDRIKIGTSRSAEACPYCQAKDFVKRGVRKNRYHNNSCLAKLSNATK
jgi:hypothetical protein